MFGLFASEKSPIRQRLERVAGVRGTRIEWILEAGLREPILVVEYEWDLDPASPGFDAEGFAQISAAANQADAGEGPPPRIRIVPYSPNA